MNTYEIERQESNVAILMELAQIVEKYPGLRFMQILTICGIDGNFNEESTVTLNKLKDTLKMLDGWKDKK